MAQTSIAANPTVAVAGTFATGYATPLNTRSLEAAETIPVRLPLVIAAAETNAVTAS